MAFEKITIRQFKNCWFNEDYSQVSVEDFNTCYTEYIDTAGMFATKEFDIIADIHFLKNRKNTIELSIELQAEFCNEFGEPFKDNLLFLRKQFNYKVDWTGDKVKFYKDLEKIISKEAYYRTQLKSRQKELDNERQNAPKEEKKTPAQQRQSFIRLINSLGKIGFKIDEDKNTVEDLSLMILQQVEENDALEKRNNSYAR